jgi:cyclopropane-fatty-acyl-phospholipid synthase
MNSITEAVRSNTKLLPKSAQLFFKVLSKIKRGNITVIGPDNITYEFSGDEPGENILISIRDWRTCDQLLQRGDIGLGESYIDGHWECLNTNGLIKLGIDNYDEFASVIKGSILKIIFYRLKHLLNRNTKKGSARNIHAHYDLGNDFYSLWLDKTMTYSSALYKSNDDSLEQAQEQKYQNILNELNIKPGDHILEIGCGWGGFMDYAASRGIKVTGITISQEQYNYAKNRLEKHGNLTTILLQDYRDLEGSYTHIVSIEMFEALGEEYWSTYFKKVKELLSSSGKAVIQTIHINDKDFNSYRKGTDFIQQYIFPGGMLPSPSVFKKEAISKGFIVENELEFGLDYAKTLHAWEDRFNEELDSVYKMGYDENFVRTWRFYLKYCQGGFEAKKIGVAQFTLTTK